MTTTRLIPILTLILAIAGGLSAQQTTPASGTAAESSTAAPEAASKPDSSAAGSQEIRNLFANLLRQNPSELATILVLDPTLLSNEAFLAGYPELARFVAEHPEVRRNPRYYLAAFSISGESIVEQIFESLAVISVFILIVSALVWLIRTIIEQKRWNRLSRIQTEVHNKILDRFGTTSELLEYIRSPAGTKFLESAPIPLHAEPATNNPSLTRVMWSIQIGVIVAAAALGLLIVSDQFDKETAQGLSAMGVIALSVGVGFLASAAVSIFLSRRLERWQSPHPSETASAEDPGRV